jgi:hypothetical protein
MSDPEYQRSYFKKRYAEDPEFRRRRREVNNDYRRRRSAGDPEWRARESARCARANRNGRLMRRYGITVDAFDAQLASQHGACAACREKLCRIVRVDKRTDSHGVFRLLCTRCTKHVETIRHVLAHARDFEAYVERWQETDALTRIHALLRQVGRMPCVEPKPHDSGRRSVLISID